MKINIHERAADEFDEAIGWYELRSKGLGRRFRKSVTDQLKKIREWFPKEAGYETEMKFVPWKSALLKTEEGEYHALMGAFRSDERAAVLAYPEYGYESQKMFFSLKGRNIRYRKLEDLCPFRLGLLRGSVHTEELGQVRCLKTDFTGDETEAMKILLAGRVDIIVADKENLYYSMEKHFPGRADDVEPAYPPFHTKKVYTVFSKKFPAHRQYVKDYDEGIKRIQEDGTYEKILKKHGVRPLTE